MPKTELERRFAKAVWLIRNGPPADSSTSVKLKYYGLFKQATEGDCTAAQPWAVQARACLVAAPLPGVLPRQCAAPATAPSM